VKITRVEYRETVTFGNYQNATVGATAEVQEWNPVSTLAELKTFVQGELQKRKSAQEDEEELRYQKGVKDDELNRLQVRIDEMKVKWEAAKAFLEKHGVDTSRYADDIPF
jgi:hypothetical protein